MKPNAVNSQLHNHLTLLIGSTLNYIHTHIHVHVPPTHTPHTHPHTHTQNGIPSLGFTAMNHTPILVHDHNEFLNERAFLAGIEIHEDVVAALASVEGTN